MDKRICFFTGNRAEFSLLRPLIEGLKGCSGNEVQLIVSGSHLDPGYGSTIKEIEGTNIPISWKTKRINDATAQLVSVPVSIASSIIETTKALEHLKPTLFVVYADRFESFGAAIAASQSGIPVIHIEGGDVTEGGCLDDNVRHAMTKISHIHCSTSIISYRRILQLGEEKWRVLNIGLPSLDDIYQGKYTPPEEVMRILGLHEDRPIIIFTLHSVAAELREIKMITEECTAALSRLITECNAQIVCTYPNNDTGSRVIIEGLSRLKKMHGDSVQVHESLGGALYHGTLAIATLAGTRVVSMGNSSSGIKETCCFRCPHINIGNRQSGRLAPDNVINVGYKGDDIFSRAKQLIYLDRYDYCSNADPYWAGGAAARFSSFIEKLYEIPVEKLLIKRVKETSLSV